MNRIIINNQEMEFQTMEFTVTPDGVTVNVQTNGQTASIASQTPCNFVPKEPVPSLNFQNFDLFLRSLFSVLNAPAHVDGYRYLWRAIELSMDDPQMFTSITKNLYPRLAEEFNVSTSRIERSLHSTIIAILDGNAKSAVREFFGAEYQTITSRRSNAYVISVFVTRIKLILAIHPLETPRVANEF